MIVALIDNGSLAAAAHRNLRALALALAQRTGTQVEAVSWKHSDRINPEMLDGVRAQTLVPWLTRQVLAGQREFVFIPFFVSAQGAIGSWLRKDIEKLQSELGGFRFAFTSGLNTQGALVHIVSDRIRETIRRHELRRPPVIVVDHGGPSPRSAQLRDSIAAELHHLLRTEISSLAAASLEGAEYRHNLPVFTDVLASAGFDRGDVVVAPLFLAPGRHAGPRGDLMEIAVAAEDRLTAAPLRCHFTELVGTHPDVTDVLAHALTQTLSTFHAAA